MAGAGGQAGAGGSAPEHPPGTHADIVYISLTADKNTNPGGAGWMDSFSHDKKCWCDSSFDHDVGQIVVSTPFGDRTVGQVCAAQKDSGQLPTRGPDDPIYNDIQCGNGPPNGFGDEDPDKCPGRVDIGGEGCAQIGPKWDFDALTGHL